MMIHHPFAGFGADWSVDRCDAMDMDYEASSDTCVPPPHPDDPVQPSGGGGGGGSRGSSAPAYATTSDAGMAVGPVPWILGGAVVLGIIYYVVAK
jgi:hypothetical protein